MAWNPHPKVADCRTIARKWGKDQVIILAINTKENTIEYASYGQTKALCDQARRIADQAMSAATLAVSAESLVCGPRIKESS